MESLTRFQLAFIPEQQDELAVRPLAIRGHASPVNVNHIKQSTGMNFRHCLAMKICDAPCSGQQLHQTH